MSVALRGPVLSLDISWDARGDMRFEWSCADLVGRLECVCAFDGGALSGPLIDTLRRSPALPPLVGSGITLALSLFTAPLGANGNHT